MSVVWLADLYRFEMDGRTWTGIHSPFWDFSSSTDRIDYVSIHIIKINKSYSQLGTSTWHLLMTFPPVGAIIYKLGSQEYFILAPKSVADFSIPQHWQPLDVAQCVEVR